MLKQFVCVKILQHVRLNAFMVHFIPHSVSCAVFQTMVRAEKLQKFYTVLH